MAIEPTSTSEDILTTVGIDPNIEVTVTFTLTELIPLASTVMVAAMRGLVNPVDYDTIKVAYEKLVEQLEKHVTEEHLEAFTANLSPEAKAIMDKREAAAEVDAAIASALDGVLGDEDVDPEALREALGLLIDDDEVG